MCKHCTETWYDLGQAWLLLLLTWIIVGSFFWLALNYVSPTFGGPTLTYAEGLALFAAVRIVAR